MKGMLVLGLLIAASGMTSGSAADTQPIEPGFKVEFESRWAADRLIINYPTRMTANGQAESAPPDPSVSPKLVPAANCRWEWISERQLGCRLSNADRLVAATAYDLIIPAQTTAAGETIAGGTHHFETARPALNSGTVNWLSERVGELTLRFSAPVDLLSLRQHAYLLDQETGERLTLSELKPAEQQNNETFLTTLPALRASGAYALGFADGIKPITGHLSMIAHERRNIVLVPGPFALLGMSCVPVKAYPISFVGIAVEPACDPARGIYAWFTEQPSPTALETLRAAVGAVSVRSDSIRHEASADGHAKRLVAVQLSGLPSDRKIDVAISKLTDIWNRDLAKQRVRFETSEWAPSLELRKNTSLVHSLDAAVFRVNSINAKRLVMHLEQASADGLTYSKHRISVPDFKSDSWQTWNLDLSQYLDKRGSLARGRLETRSGQILAGFTMNYQPDEFIVRRIDNRLLIWALDGTSKRPLTNAAVHLRNGLNTETNRATGLTDHMGFVQLQLPAEATADSRNKAREDTWWLRVEANQRVNTVPMSLYDWNTGSWESATYREPAFRVPVGDKLVWGITDKHLYSPGEALQYSFFVRHKGEQRFSCVEQKTAYHLGVFDPDENIIIQQGPLQLDHRCAASGQIELPATLNHGQYHIIVRDKPISRDDFDDDSSETDISFRGRFLFEISNPRPPAINVTASFDQMPWQTWKGPLNVTTMAHYFSGGPQRDATLSMHGSFYTSDEYDIEERDPRTARFPGYRFEVFDAEERLDLLEDSASPGSEVTADANGSMITAVRAYDWLPGYSQFGANIASKASDGQEYEGWVENLDVFHNSEFVGLRLKSRYPRVGDPLDTSLLVLNQSFVAVQNKPVVLTLYEHERQNRGYSSDNTFRRVKVAATCATQSRLDPVNCSVSPTLAGSYELVAAITDSVGRKHESSIWLRVYGQDGWRADNSDSPEMTLQADKRNYQAGETAKIELQQPFTAGRVLVTVERNRGLQTFWLDVVGSTQSFDVPISAEMENGVSVTAQFTPTGTDQVIKPLTARLSLKVAAPSLRSITIKTDKPTYRPGDKVTATVQLPAGGKRGILLTAVDSALLKLMYDADSYFSPDNSEFLQTYRTWRVAEEVDFTTWLSRFEQRVDIEQQRPLAMLHRQSVAPAPQQRVENFWGDDDEEQRIEVTGSRIKRTDIIPPATDDSAVLPKQHSRNDQHWRARIRQHFRQNAYWLAQGETDDNGAVTLQFLLPDNLTGWTLMAVSYDADHEFGFAKTEFQASLPIETRITGPEHAVQGDRIGVSATVRNAEDRRKTVKAKLTLQGDSPIEPITRHRQIQQNGFHESSLTAQIDTGNAAAKPSTVRWLIQAQDASGEDAVAGDVQLRSPTYDKRIQHSLLLLPGQATEWNFKRPTDAFDNALSIRWQSLSLLAGVQETLDYMQRYPHRCWEQRTSRVWSAVLGRQLLADTTEANEQVARDALLDDWIKQSAPFQAPNGGFSYWRGEDRYADLYLSTYTAQAFLNFRKLGWQGGAEVERRLQRYLQAQRRSQRQSADARPRDSTTQTAQLLASLDANTLTTESFTPPPAELTKLNSETLIWLLKAAVRSNPKSAQTSMLRQALLARGFARSGMVELKEEPEAESWYWLGSTQRSQCLAASILVQTASNDAERTEAYSWLRSAQLKRHGNGEFGNTQENAHCLQAIADFAAVGFATPEQAQLRAIVNDLPITLPVKKAVSIAAKADNRMQLQTGDSTAQWIDLSVGYRADAKRDSNRELGFSLRRDYEVFRANRWQPVGAQPLAVGEWVRVTLSLSAHQFQTHVALSDALPGAWVAVDPEHDATVPLHTLGEPKQSWNFYERQFHDGYARFYAESLYPGEYQVQYLAKVITHGRYQALPARVEAMYEGGRFATSANQQVTVSVPK